MRSLFALVTLMGGTLIAQQPCWAFQSRLPNQPRFNARDSQRRQVPKLAVVKAKRSMTGDFELQELKVQIDSMKRQGVASRSLPPTKRFELESYARAIIENKESPVPLELVGKNLPNTKWQLVFSTENSALSDLPRDANVVLNFWDITNMDYSLKFGKSTSGLNSITAKSTWKAGEGNNREGSYPGLVTVVYDKITCNAFGFSNMGIGFFGMLKGRASYIQTVYFDNELWIEGGYAPDGSSYFSVYTRENN
uniref:Plastid lipid-associated protein/fibrillin conserved domain-containing protein n=1 Tax=Amphora coffeiformis TaxID=265554 RepID=A0A7S3L3Y3_9STRA|mmetsp:Transcript_5487/g.11235  ORF Transcript_5487/g.11235 Transcript_5487/m.11235 type:complete len:251 (+) Transcript_5487:115-867(+)|eukprot:scaffold5795_cov165-Amphora_coffeaeformis.AAC.11